MPIIAIVVVAFIGVALLSRRDTTPRQDVPPKLPVKDGVVRNDANKLNTGFSALIKIGADAFVGEAFASKESKAVATYGLAIAIAIGAMNLVAGVLIAMVVLVVAAFVDVVVAADDFAHDHHLEGIDRYQQSWAECYGKLHDFFLNDAMVKQQTPNMRQLELACGAYADGFMSQLNYLKAWSAYCGGIWGRNSGGPNFGMIAVKRAWYKGLFASDYEAGISQAAVNSARVNVPALAAQSDEYITSSLYGIPGATMDPMNNIPMGGHFGARLLQIGEPLSQYPAQLYSGDEKTLIETYNRYGTMQANATSFLHSCQQPVPAFSNRFSMIVDQRNKGFFQGVPLSPPDVPENLGVGLQGCNCYARTGDSEIVFLTV